MSDFKTTEEIYKYLLEGNTLISNSTNRSFAKSLVKLINGFLSTKPIDGSWHKDTWNFGNPKMWSKYKEPEWFENIPEQGVLCKVRDSDPFKDMYCTIVRIFKYKGNGYVLGAVDGHGRAYSVSIIEPLLKSELQKFYDYVK